MCIANGKVGSANGLPAIQREICYDAAQLWTHRQFLNGRIQPASRQVDRLDPQARIEGACALGWHLDITSQLRIPTTEGLCSPLRSPPES